MSPTALIEKPSVSQLAVVASAPARLDVHHVPELEAWINVHGADRAGQLVLDCSAVEFIDQTAVDAILSAEHDPERQLRIARPSTAMRITFELLGHTIAGEAVAA
jgi:anti-anti-sigma regulatory factor